MIAILDNLISFSMLLIGFGLDNFIIILRSHLGFIGIFSSISFFEYSTAKSIIKDIKKINISTALSSVKNYKLSKSIKPWTQRSLQTFYSLFLSFF